MNTNTGELKQLREMLSEVDGLSQVFRVLGDETRTKLIYLLSLKELCVCDIAEILGISVPAVSHHLRLLRQCASSDAAETESMCIIRWMTTIS